MHGWRISLVMGLVAFGACGVDPRDELDDLELNTQFEEKSEDIVGGTVSNAFPQVGALYWSAAAGGGFCSAVQIAPRIIATAAHCTVGRGLPTAYLTGPGSPLPPTGGTITNVVAHAVNAEAVHPSYNPAGGNLTTLAGALVRFRADVALYRLSSASTGVASLRLATAPPALNTNCWVVGYGRSTEGPNYRVLRKRQATMRISGFQAGHMSANRNTGEVAQGDSGGPIICGGQVHGLTSFSIAPAATPTADVDWFQRTHGIRGWVNQVAATWRVAGVP